MLKNPRRTVRLVLFLLAVAVAVGAFTAAVLRYVHRDEGYHRVDYTAQGNAVLYGSGVHLVYYAEGNSSQIRAKLNEVQRVYTDSLLRYYQLLSAEEEYPGVVNLASLNRNMGQWLEIDPELAAVLSDALERTNRREGYSLFSGALHRAWRDIRYLEEPLEADPLRNADSRALLSQAAAMAGEGSHFTLELEGNRARFTADEAYLSWAQEWGLEGPALDLNLMHDGYLVQLVGRDLMAKGYWEGDLYTDLGVSLAMEKYEKLDYDINALRDGVNRSAGEIKLETPSAFCWFTAYQRPAGQYGYYVLEQDGETVFRHPYADTLSGDVRRTLMTVSLGGGADGLTDLAYAMALLHTAGTPEEAARQVSSLPRDVFAAYTLQGEEGVLYVNGAFLDRVDARNGFELKEAEAFANE